ncbi:class i sam-dependent methyltransferase [Anaeramoeba ignava]|uniref:Class i sam-dependent methyltransferase n=1 Tax=Anaeramoeba ignava TaxID=1746090 RepID=A0A9Q0R659_ANAIG|nr:class i sam-dependent methyltransferase [Anaeramoeba ignava]
MSEFDQHAQKFMNPGYLAQGKTIATRLFPFINEEILKNNEKVNILDMGCGVGAVAIPLSLLNPKFIIDGIDTSIKMIEYFQQRVEEEKVERVFPSFQAEPKPENKYNIAYASSVLHHIKDIPGFLKKIYGSLLKDGQILIVDFAKNEQSHLLHSTKFESLHYPSGFSEEELQKFLVDANFKDVKVLDFGKIEKKVTDENKNVSFRDFNFLVATGFKHD